MSCRRCKRGGDALAEKLSGVQRECEAAARDLKAAQYELQVAES